MKTRSFCRKKKSEDEFDSSFMIKNSFSKPFGQDGDFDSSRVILLSSVPSTQKSKNHKASSTKLVTQYKHIEDPKNAQNVQNMEKNQNLQPPKIYLNPEEEETPKPEGKHHRRFISLNICTGEVEIGIKTEETSKRTNPSTPEESARSFRDARKSSTTQENYIPVDKILHNLVSEPKPEDIKKFRISNSISRHLKPTNLPKETPHTQNTFLKNSFSIPSNQYLPKNPKTKPKTASIPCRPRTKNTSKRLLNLKQKRHFMPEDPDLPYLGIGEDDKNGL